VLTVVITDIYQALTMGQGIYYPAASLGLAYVGVNNPPVLKNRHTRDRKS
jgi:hypothetical protein